jgi:hypothetical protein
MQMMLTTGSYELDPEPGAKARSRVLLRSLLRSIPNPDTVLNAVYYVV